MKMAQKAIENHGIVASKSFGSSHTYEPESSQPRHYKPESLPDTECAKILKCHIKQSKRNILALSRFSDGKV